jgi:two-component system, chemotaxis family, protein-glutamate methylesterase/glutaminase
VSATEETHDIVVVGASAGGVESLGGLVRNLPADLPAAIFVVLHLASGATSALPQILTRAGSMRAVHPEDGQQLEHGCIYVAPPDHHLMLRDGTIDLANGPKENGYRPAIDPLFRSAADAYGPRTVGIVLSGALDDGSAGLRVIGNAGGTTIVQTPSEALYPGMPESAIAYAHPQYVLPIADIGRLLVELAGRPVTNGGEPMAESEQPGLPNPRPAGEPPPPGELAPLVCPDCGGSVWVDDEGGLPRYSCHVGHAYSEASFAAQHGQALETALWTSIRTLQERAALAGRIAARMRSRGNDRTAKRFERQAEVALDHVSVIERVLVGVRPFPSAEETAAEGD